MTLEEFTDNDYDAEDIPLSRVTLVTVWVLFATLPWLGVYAVVSLFL